MISIDKPAYSRNAYTVINAIVRGFKRTCPHCGNGKIFNGYLKTKDCTSCAAPTGDIRADDLPPYLTIFLVGHIVVPLLVFVEAVYHPPLWMQMAVWPSVTLLLTLLFLPFMKGAAVGLMWYLQLKGDEQR